MKDPRRQGRPSWPAHGRARARREAARRRAAVHGAAYAVIRTTAAMRDFGKALADTNAAMRDFIAHYGQGDQS